MDFSLQNIALGAVCGLVLSACATKVQVVTYPDGAKIRVENVISKESFDIGEAPVRFNTEDKFGEGFVLVAEKEGFNSRKIFITKQPGSEMNYKITLEPKAKQTAGNDNPNDPENKDKPKEDPNKAQEEKKDLEKRLAVLERTFEIYKDALFSQRYGTGPASYDRDKIDTSVDLVSKTQQLIEKRDLNGAMENVNKLLERDEYLVQAHVLKGSILYLQKDVQGAIKAWERALEIDPYQRLTRRYLVTAYKQVGRAVPDNYEELGQVDRSPAASPLQPDPLKLKLRNR